LKPLRENNGWEKMKVNFKLILIPIIVALAIMVSIHPFWVAGGMAQETKATPEKPESADQRAPTSLYPLISTMWISMFLSSL
jgi:hypothetical protein